MILANFGLDAPLYHIGRPTGSGIDGFPDMPSPGPPRRRSVFRWGRFWGQQPSLPPRGWALWKSPTVGETASWVRLAFPSPPRILTARRLSTQVGRAGRGVLRCRPSLSVCPRCEKKAMKRRFGDRGRGSPPLCFYASVRRTRWVKGPFRPLPRAISVC